jgi:hypothetical protein
LVVNGIFETEIRLVAEEQNGEIVLVNKPVTLVIDIGQSKLQIMSIIHDAGYNMVGYSGQFAKVSRSVITCVDTQIQYIPRDMYRDFPTPDLGIKKMYLVKHFHDFYKIYGCADALGTHIFAWGDKKVFLPRKCVCEIHYILPDVNAIWDFSEPIPRKLLVENTQRCGSCDWVEKN